MVVKIQLLSYGHNGRNHLITLREAQTLLMIDDARKKALLMHLIEKDSENIFESLNPGEEATFDKTLALLKNYFEVQN